MPGLSSRARVRRVPFCLRPNMSTKWARTSVSVKIPYSLSPSTTGRAPDLMVVHQLDCFFDQCVRSNGDQFILRRHKGRDFQLSQEIVEFLNAEQGCVGRCGLPNIPVCNDSNQMIVFVDDRQMSDSLLVDKVPGLKKGCIRTNGDRTFFVSFLS